MMGYGGGGGGSPFLDPRLQQLIQSAVAQPNVMSTMTPPVSPYTTQAANNPSLVDATAGAVGRLTDQSPQPLVARATSPGVLLPGDAGGMGDQSQLGGNAYGQPSSFNQTGQGQPNDQMSAWDDFKAVAGLPFRALAAGRDALQDIVGAPMGQYRDQQRAQLLALQNLSPETKAALGLAPPPTGVSNVNTGVAPVATGQPSTLGQNVQDSTQPGIFAWAKNFGRDDTQQQLLDIATKMQVQRALQQAALRQAQTFSAGTEGIQHLAGARESTAKAVTEETTGIPLARAQIGAQNASAFKSGQEGMLAQGQRTDLLPQQVAAEAQLAAYRKAQTAGETGTENRAQDAYDSFGRPVGMQGLTQAIEATREQPIRLGLQTAKDMADAYKTLYGAAHEAAGTNLDIANTNKATGLYDNATGTPSALGKNLDALMESRRKATLDFGKLVQGTGKSGAPAMDAAQAALTTGLYDVKPAWPGPLGWLPGGGAAVDYTSDPLGYKTKIDAIQAAIDAAGQGKSSAAAQPFLPMPAAPTMPDLNAIIQGAIGKAGQGGSNEDMAPQPTPTPGMLPRATGDAVAAIYQMLDAGNLGYTPDQIKDRSQEIGKSWPFLDRSSAEAFAASAKLARIPPQEARVLWRASAGG